MWLTITSCVVGSQGLGERDLAEGSGSTPLNVRWVLRSELPCLTPLMTLKPMPSLLGFLTPTGVRKTFAEGPREIYGIACTTSHLTEKRGASSSGVIVPFRIVKGQEVEFHFKAEKGP